MSTVEHVTTEVGRTPTKRTKAKLQAVPQDNPKRAWPRGVFPVTVLALLAAGLLGHLVMQTTIQEQGFTLTALQSQANSLGAQQSILEATLETRSTPQQLAFAASGLGMVANPYTTFINLGTNEITGVNRPVKGDEVPEISAPPSIPSNAAAIDSSEQAATPEQIPVTEDSQGGEQ